MAIPFSVLIMTNRLNEKNYVIISEWMLDLKLTARELFVFALIYGFCQDGKSSYYGSLDYLCSWLGIKDKANCLRTLNSLVKKGIINKEKFTVNSKKRCRYFINRHIICENSEKNDYIAVQGWMTEELHLTGKDLILYALIHGFCRTSPDGSCLYRKEYFAKWIHSDRKNVDRQIASLISKNAIQKAENSIFDKNCSQNDISFSQNDKSEILKMTTENIDLQHKNNKSEQEYTDSCFSVSEFRSCEEIQKSLTAEQMRILNSLSVKAMTHEIDSTKEGVIRYFGILQQRNWKDSYGRNIRDVEKYVVSNFRYYSENKAILKKVSGGIL